MTTLVLELLHRAHQTNVALLNEIQEVHAAVDVLLRNGDDQAQVGADHLALATLGAALTALNLAHGLSQHALLHAQLVLNAVNDRHRLLQRLIKLPGDRGVDARLLKVGTFTHAVELAPLIHRLAADPRALRITMQAPLTAIDVIDSTLEVVDELVNEALRKQTILHSLYHALVGALARLLGLLAGFSVVALKRFGELAVFAFQRPVGPAQLVETLEHLRGHRRVAIIAAGLILIEDLPGTCSSRAQPVGHGQDHLNGRRRVHQDLEDDVAARLDLFGDRHLSLTREQAHLTNAAQVHLHRVQIPKILDRLRALLLCALLAPLADEVVLGFAGHCFPALRIGGLLEIGHGISPCVRQTHECAALALRRP